MKTLVVYYSLEGNCKFIAECIAKRTEVDILELKPLKDVSKKGFGKFVWGGKQVIFKEKPELAGPLKNPQEYDLIIIGSPVWAGTYAPALNTFFSKTSIKGKNIALYCCCGGGKGKIFEKMKKVLSEENKYISEKEFLEPLSKDKEKIKAEVFEWVDMLH